MDKFRINKGVPLCTPYRQPEKPAAAEDQRVQEDLKNQTNKKSWKNFMTNDSFCISA